MVSQQPGKGTPRTGGGGSSLNKAMIIGNLGGDPEMRFTPSGISVTSFNVATNRAYKTADGERRDETEWFTVVAWNKLAETCNQYLTKGQKVYAEGRLRTHSWDGQDGQKHFRLEINADRVIFLDKRASAPPGEEKFAEGEGGDIEPQDIPF